MPAAAPTRPHGPGVADPRGLATLLWSCQNWRREDGDHGHATCRPAIEVAARHGPFGRAGKDVVRTRTVATSKSLGGAGRTTIVMGPGGSTGGARATTSCVATGDDAPTGTTLVPLQRLAMLLSEVVGSVCVGSRGQSGVTGGLLASPCRRSTLRRSSDLATGSRVIQWQGGSNRRQAALHAEDRSRLEPGRGALLPRGRAASYQSTRTSSPRSMSRSAGTWSSRWSGNRGLATAMSRSEPPRRPGGT